MPEKKVEAEQSHNLFTMSKERECFKQVTNLSESVPSFYYYLNEFFWPIDQYQ